MISRQLKSSEKTILIFIYWFCKNSELIFFDFWNFTISLRFQALWYSIKNCIFSFLKLWLSFKGFKLLFYDQNYNFSPIILYFLIDWRFNDCKSILYPSEVAKNLKNSPLKILRTEKIDVNRQLKSENLEKYRPIYDISGQSRGKISQKCR